MIYKHPKNILKWNSNVLWTRSPKFLVVKIKGTSLTFTAEHQVMLVVTEVVKQYFLLFTVLTSCQNIFLGFILVTAHPTAEHRNMALQEMYESKALLSIQTTFLSDCVSGLTW